MHFLSYELGVAQRLILNKEVKVSWIHWENLDRKKARVCPGMDLPNISVDGRTHLHIPIMITQKPWYLGNLCICGIYIITFVYIVISIHLYCTMHCLEIKQEDIDIICIFLIKNSMKMQFLDNNMTLIPLFFNAF